MVSARSKRPAPHIRHTVRSRIIGDSHSLDGDDAKRTDVDNAGFVTLGDIGYLDADGYLCLNDEPATWSSPMG
ncbi:hypothetical protein [Nocardia sp. NPDC005998]|uniref:hypothetical protein n=1 Tax=Nocardia sp. NPDC005998 TaxID=3156894 RepID=UPI0033AC67EE